MRRIPKPKPTAGSWIKLALGAQGLLLLVSCVMFFYRFVWLPQFPAGGIIGSEALQYLVRLIPNLLLLALLILDARCTASLGMVLAAAVTLLTVTVPDYPIVPYEVGIFPWLLSLVCLALANFYSLNNTTATLRMIKMPFQYTIVKVLLACAGACALLVGTPFLLGSLMFSGLGDQNPGGHAPESGYATRRAWGQKMMPRYFSYVDKWVRKSELIAGDIGKVTKVAPIGWPNNYVTFFTDGPSVMMNLQVVGEHGEGILTLPRVSINTYPTKTFEIDSFSTWHFNDNPTSIVSSGKSWINEHGFGEQHRVILSAAGQANHDRVLQGCFSLDQMLPDQFGEIDLRKWGRELYSEMFLGLPPSDRRAMLMLLGDSHVSLGNKDDALDCYLDASGVSFNAIENPRWNYSCSRYDVAPAVITRELEKANEALKKAHQLVPENETLQKLARNRSMLAYRHRIGQLLEPTWNLTDEQLRDRSIAELRDLYKIPMKMARRSPWLREELGEMRFRCEKNSANQLFINKHNRYQARVKLEVTGSTGVTGAFEMKVFETPELTDAIDLYAPFPRFPQTYYRGNSLRWYPKGEKRVSLNSKTLMPRKKSSKKKKSVALKH